MAFVLLIWLTMSFGIGIMGTKRNLGFAGAFILSVILSPVIGFVITIMSEKKHTGSYNADAAAEELLILREEENQDHTSVAGGPLN